MPMFRWTMFRWTYKRLSHKSSVCISIICKNVIFIPETNLNVYHHDMTRWCVSMLIPDGTCIVYVHVWIILFNQAIFPRAAVPLISTCTLKNYFSLFQMDCTATVSLSMSWVLDHHLHVDRWCHLPFVKEIG